MTMLDPQSASQASQPEGRIIGGYRVLRHLGSGGMGAVYEAVDATIGKRAAIKLLHPQFSQNPRFAARFVNEARAVNLVEHPGLVEVFGFGQLPDHTAYLVMEYLDGETLKERLRRGAGQPMPYQDALPLLRQLAEALTVAHGKGVVHRDLKPENIMLLARAEGAPRCKILDFGIAKLVFETAAEGTNTETDALLGTPQYMSPEQCLGAGHVDDRADVYSLGVIAYQMLAGRPPFVGEGKGALLLMQMTQAPVPLQVHAPQVPKAIAELVRRMLAKKREDRPRMDQVAQTIRALEQGGIIPPRRPVVVVAPLVVGTLLVLGTLTVLLRSRAPDHGSAPASAPDLISAPDLRGKDVPPDLAAPPPPIVQPLPSLPPPKQVPDPRRPRGPKVRKEQPAAYERTPQRGGLIEELPR